MQYKSNISHSSNSKSLTLITKDINDVWCVMYVLCM